MSTLFSCYICCFCIILFYVPSYTASVQLNSQQEKCERIHRIVSLTDYGCGPCKDGYYESSNRVCASECPSAVDCDSRHRDACTENTNGKCGACVQPYIDLAGYCVTEKKAAEAINILEQLVAAKQAASSDSGTNNAGSSPVKKSEKVPDAVKTVSTPTNQSPGIAGADKRVAAGEMPPEAPAIDLSVAESDGASIGFSKLLFFCIIAGATLVCLISLIIAGICWYRLHKVRKSMQPSEYVGGGESYSKDSVARSDSSGDRKLAHSAQMYLYQHHKQQMMAAESSLSDKMDESDGEESEENEDGNYTVYECPGLAPAGEMEVSNPLFQATSKVSPSTSPSETPASMPSPQQSSMSTSQEGDDSTHD